MSESDDFDPSSTMLSEYFLTTSCCCLDIETGSLILGYVEAFFQAFVLLHLAKDPSSSVFILNTIIMMIFVGFVYGIHKVKFEFMLPNLILSFLALVALIFVWIVLPICMVAGWNIQLNIPYDGSDVTDAVKSLSGASRFGVWIILAISALLQWHFTSVKYSLYTLMKAVTEGMNIAVIAPSSLFNLIDTNSYDYNRNHSYQLDQRNKSKNKNKSRTKKSRSQYQKF